MLIEFRGRGNDSGSSHEWERVRIYADLEEPVGHGPVGVNRSVVSAWRRSSQHRGWSPEVCLIPEVGWLYQPMWLNSFCLRDRKRCEWKNVFKKENLYLLTIFKTPGLMLIALPLTPCPISLYSSKRNLKSMPITMVWCKNESCYMRVIRLGNSQACRH